MTTSIRNTTSRLNKSAVFAVAIAASVLVVAGGCAYYNMLYNAKKEFKRADEMPPQRDGTVSRQQDAAFQTAIDKARAMIKKYPDSRHVDDAYLLIARAEYAQQKYEAAIGTVDTLLQVLPETELKEKAEFVKARSYVKWEKDLQALTALESFMKEYPRSDYMAEALYLAARCALVLEDEDKAAGYVKRLREEHRGSDYRLEADIEIAEIYLQKGEYDKCIDVYERLTRNRLEKKDRFRVWSSLARAYVKTGRPEDALSALKAVDKLALSDTERAEALLLRASALAGEKSTDEAIDVYKNVAAWFPNSMFSSEAHYRMAELYQKIDSLEVAKTEYEWVTKDYPRSEYAERAIKNASNIAQLIRLRDSEGQDNPESQALRLLSLAEMQLFQFDNAEKALESYQKLLADYPQSEVAPKAGYAVAYVYEVVLGDSVKAREAYRTLIRDYPDSQQAALAREALGLPPVPPVEREAVRPEEEAGEAGESASVEGTRSP